MSEKQVNIINELHQNFIDFAYEANSQRAFPDARDGLKPGQRACLWEMYHKGYTSSKAHVKSAKISGGVVGAWWPHGDVAVYDTFARMSQSWINNIPEVDWHGLNGNIIIGNEPAAARYTEARLSKATEEGLFANIKKNVVNMIPNYSEDDKWPEVLPALMPRLMINGSQGIGVTIANTWVSHNLADITRVVKEYVKEGKIDTQSLYPDFPTGGIIINKKDIHTIYETGKGRVIVRGKVEVKGNSIFITELPYQTFVEPFIDSIRELIKSEELTGIRDIFNKTDKKQLLIEIVCDSPNTVLNKLYAKTDLQKTFNPNQFALVGKTPKLLTLKQYLDIYINHNKECLSKEFTHELEKAKLRLEIVEGLIKALEDIDNIIDLIKKSESSSAAVGNLMQIYQFTERQAKSIVDMKLGRLANLEKIELNQEHTELLSEIKKLNELLSTDVNLLNVFLDRLLAFTKKFATPRKTEVIQIDKPKETDETIYVEPEKCVVVMTEGGSIKRIPQTSFRTQKRAGKGVKTQDDITSCVIRTNTVDQLMIFTNQGNMYRLLVDNIPVGTNVSKGTPIVGLVEMNEGEIPVTIYSIYKDTDAKYLMFVTKNGLCKKTSLEEYTKTKKKTGISAINIKDGDELANVFLIKDENVIITTQQGYAIRFDSMEIGATSRTTSGIKGIALREGDYVSAAMPLRDTTDELAVVLSSGIGKKIKLSELAIQKRAGKGLQVTKLSDNTVTLAAAALISPEDNILIVGNLTSVCISAADIPSLSRASLGNQLIKGNIVKSISKV